MGSGGGWVLESGVREARSREMELADPSWGVVQKSGRMSRRLRVQHSSLGGLGVGPCEDPMSG